MTWLVYNCRTRGVGQLACVVTGDTVQWFHGALGLFLRVYFNNVNSLFNHLDFGYLEIIKAL